MYGRQLTNKKIKKKVTLNLVIANKLYLYSQVLETCLRLNVQTAETESPNH